MKRLLILMCVVGLTFGASAQTRVHGGGGSHYIRPRVTVIAPVRPYYGLGYGLGYNPYGFAPYGYTPFGYSPFYNQRVDSKPTQLDLKLDDIKNDYSYQLSSVRHDKSLSKDERKQKIRDLKHEKEDAIIEAKKSYYGANDAD